MADSQYGVAKVYGFTQTGVENLTSNFEFITIAMTTDIRPTSGGGSATSQAALDKLIQIVSERGQPVIMGNVTGSGPYTIKLAIEHPAVWSCTANASSSPNFTTVSTANPNVFMPDARLGEDLATKIAADGVNYGLTVSGTITYNSVLS